MFRLAGDVLSLRRELPAFSGNLDSSCLFRLCLVGAVLGGTRVEDVILAGMNPQHAIVSGMGATPSDSNGYPFVSRYTIPLRTLSALGSG